MKISSLFSCVAVWAILATSSNFGIAQQAVAPKQPKASVDQEAKKKLKKPKSPTIYWPAGIEANKQIPTPKEFFGFEVGHRHLRHDQVAAYMQEIARRSDRVTIEQYAETHGGRPCLLLTITSPANHGRLEKIQRRHRQLAKPAANSKGNNAKLNNEQPDLSDLPVVMNMGYGVHGDEPSATNTSPLVAHYLAAAEGPEIDEILKNSVILLDPSLNPDGFDRFARWTNTFRGKVPNPDSAHIEHNQGWPPGRVNYYWFDLNRDWLPLQHPESQGRMKWYHKWKPNVVLDFHEMGTNSTFFFQPGVPERKNPLTPIENVQLTAEMGAFHAKALDQKGSLYFTQEVFDDFYMGKGSTYPDLHGSIGILFEQGSSRGHIQESANGVIRFSDTISNQFTASLSSLQGAAALREKLLKHKHNFYRKSMKAAAKSKHRAYAFTCGNNRTRLQKFADILLRHDIKCHWLTKDAVVDDRVIKAGSLIVPADQPEYRFLRSLIERRQKFKEPVFYDVSAWTLPLSFNLKQVGLKSTISEESLRRARLGERDTRELSKIDENTVALFMDWQDDGALRTMQQLLAKDVHVRVALRPMSATIGGDGGEASEPFGFGTISIPLGIKQNATKRRAIRQIVNRAAKNGVRVESVTSGLANAGIDLGSNSFPRVEPRKVAMLVGGGISAYQAGAVWHQLDNRIGMPVSMIKVQRAASTDFGKYNTVVMVSGQYDIGNQGWEKLQNFVRDGGTLIALSGAATTAENNLLQLPPVDAEVDMAEKTNNADPATENVKASIPKFSEARKLAALKLVSGAIFATEIDTTHPLMFGFESNRLPVFRGSTNLLQTATPEVSNPSRYSKTPLIAGYASEENQAKIAGTSAVTVHSMGRGRVILMIDDPNFRAFWPATSRVFMNAIFFGQFSNAR